MCTKSLSESPFSPDLLDIGTILFSFNVQKDFAMIANEDAKDKLSAINDFVDSAVIGRTLMIVLIEKVKVCEKTGQLIYNLCVQFSCKCVYWLRQAYKITSDSVSPDSHIVQTR